MKFRIREARQAANLTQRELAEMLGIKDATLSGYEIGAHDPKSNTLIEIARICGTTVDYLLGIDRAVYAEAFSEAEKKPAEISGLSEKKIEFIRSYAVLTPVNRRLLLGIAALLLQSQEQPLDSPD